MILFGDHTGGVVPQKAGRDSTTGYSSSHLFEMGTERRAAERVALRSPLCGDLLSRTRDPDNTATPVVAGPPKALRRLLHDLAQDVGEDAAVLVVVDFDGSVDAQNERDVFHVAVGALDLEVHFLPRLDRVAEALE